MAEQLPRNIVRWLPDAWDAVGAAGIRDVNDQPRITALLLAVVNRETGGTGDPKIYNKSGAVGLTQILDKGLKAQAEARGGLLNPKVQLRLWADTLVANRKWAGDWVTAAWAWGSGPSAVKQSIKAQAPKGSHDKIAKHALGYYPTLLERDYVLAGRAVNAWRNAGSPRPGVGNVGADRAFNEIDFGAAPSLTPPWDGVYSLNTGERWDPTEAINDWKGGKVRQIGEHLADFNGDGKIDTGEKIAIGAAAVAAGLAVRAAFRWLRG